MRPYICAACLLSFPTPAELERHACRVIQPQARICPLCGLAFTEADSFWDAHLAAHQAHPEQLPGDPEPSDWYARLQRYIDRQLAAGPTPIPELADPVRQMPPLTDWEWIGLWALMKELEGDDLKL